MPKCFVSSLLTILFLFVYLYLFDLLWYYFPIHSSGGILIGSIIVLIASFMFARLTTNKLIAIIRS